MNERYIKVSVNEEQKLRALLDKATAKPATLVDFRKGTVSCPSCEETILATSRYCPACGQKLDDKMILL